MKKLLLTLILITLVLTGCSKKVSGAFTSKDFDSLEALNEEIGTNIVKVNDDVTNETFMVIDDVVANYSFDYDGASWIIKGSKIMNEDISGIDDDSFQEGQDYFAYTDDYCYERFFTSDHQYVIYMQMPNSNYDQNKFSNTSFEIEKGIKGITDDDNGLINVYEEGDDVIYEIYQYDANNNKTTIRIIYGFEDDKMVSMKNEFIFSSEEEAKAYYDELKNSDSSTESVTLDGNRIYADNNSQVSFYEDVTKEEFLNQMKSYMK